MSNGKYIWIISLYPVKCYSVYVSKGKKKPPRSGGLTLRSIECLCKLLIAYLHFGRLYCYNKRALIDEALYLILDWKINQSLVSVYSSIECPAGYKKSHSGYNCSVPCRHPSYGARCGGRCNCSEEDCHHVYGCHLTSESWLGTVLYSYFSKVPLSAYFWFYHSLLLCRLR